MTQEKDAEDRAREVTSLGGLQLPFGGLQMGVPPAEYQDKLNSMQRLQMRTRLQEVCIVEQERTKRVAFVVSCVLVLAAAVTVVFAPSGREAVCYGVGMTLLASATALIAYVSVRGKSETLKVLASD